MPIAVPQAAPPTYAELVEQAVALIPSLCPGWTDYNPSDPGIMLIELFAWLSEMLHYRIDTIPPAHYWAFLALLNDTRPGNDGEWQKRQKLPLDEAMRQTIQELRAPYRAVTTNDYERLVVEEWPREKDAKPISRVYCAPGYNLESSASQKQSDDHISLVIMPDEQRASLKQWLDARRLLGTVLHVVGPQFVPITISATLNVRSDYSLLEDMQDSPDNRAMTIGKRLAATDKAIQDAVEQQAITALMDYFDRQRWPFGRGVYRSEIYRLLDSLPGVDYVEQVIINQLPIAAIPLAEYELVSLAEKAVTLFVNIAKAS